MDTIFTPTTVSSLNSAAIYDTLQPIAVLVLIVLIIQRELVTGVHSELTRYYRQIVLVGIVPLLFVFLLILGLNLI
ncbi:MAG: hypothetical protein JXA10_09440 [Anaerolineae bacterium]|nr:hypothetical protein [Anaerolineae bacterium]